MKNLALFDLDHTLLPLDSDYEWGEFLTRIGAVDPVEFARRNDEFFAQYQAGTLDPVVYLEFALGTLAQFTSRQLDDWHQQFMHEVIRPAIRPSALDLLQRHRDSGDLMAIVTATNQFVTDPIARELGIENLIAAVPEKTPEGAFTGRLLGLPSQGEGKLIHVAEWLSSMGRSLADFEQSHFYSDSQNDIPLLSAVTHPVATNPNARLREHALAKGWPLLHLFDDQ